MNIVTGNVYRFIFKTSFTDLDGPYKVMKILPYETVLREGVDLFKFLFQLANLTEDDLNGSYASFKDETFYELVNVVTGQIIYVPELYLKSHPEYDIAQYQKLVLGFNLGVFADKDLLEAVKTSILEVLSVKYGITAEPHLMGAGTTWLSRTEYEDTETVRETTKGEVVNYYSECIKVNTENARLRGQVAALEEIINKLNGGTP